MMHHCKKHIFVLALLVFCKASYLMAMPVQRVVDFSWQKVPQAKTYEVELSRQSAEKKMKPILERTKTNRWRGKLAPGTYGLRIRSIDNRGVAGQWSPSMDLKVAFPSVVALKPKPQASILANKSGSGKVQFAWKSFGKGVHYELKVSGGDDFEKIRKLKKSKFVMKLAGGKAYTWQIRVFDADDGPEDSWSKKMKFSVQLLRLDTPKIVREFSATDKSLKWSKPVGTETYSWLLQKKRAGKGKKKWKTISKNEKYSGEEIKLVDLRKNGRYRITIAAEAKTHRPSLALRYVFQYKAGSNSEGNGKEVMPVGPHYLRMGYNYLPFLRRSTLTSSSGTGNVNEIVFNSNGFGARYRYLGGFFGGGIGGQFHLAKSSVFEDAGEDETSGQESLKINTIQFKLDAELALTMGRFSTIFAFGGGQREFPIFYQKTAEAISGEEAKVVETEIRIGALFSLSPTGNIFANFLQGSALSKEPSMLTDYGRTELNTGFSHQLLLPKLVARYMIVVEKLNLNYGPDEHDLEYQTTVSAFYFGGQIGYVF